VNDQIIQSAIYNGDIDVVRLIKQHKVSREVT